MISVEFINAETDYRYEQLRRAWGGRRRAPRARRRRPPATPDEPAGGVVAPAAPPEAPERVTVLPAVG